MADHQTVTFSDEPLTENQKAEDFQEHTHTYRAFMTLTKWSIIAVTVVLIALYLFLVR